MHAALVTATQEAEIRRTAWVRDKQDAETQRKNLLAQYEDLREQRFRLEKAGAEGDCPTCRRPLGSEYEHVVGVLGRQMEEVRFQGNTADSGSISFRTSRQTWWRAPAIVTGWIRRRPG